MAFTGLDVYFPNISNIKTRKTVVLGELAASGKLKNIVINIYKLIALIRCIGFLMVYWFLLYD
jgi:hypothetical protein